WTWRPGQGRAATRLRHRPCQHSRAPGRALRQRGEHRVGAIARRWLFHSAEDAPIAPAGQRDMTKDDDVLRTMIVDDEPLAIERMQVLCAELDQLQVVGTASDGEAAVRLADKLKPDLLLLDMTMPGMDGLAVARLLGKREKPPAVIFVTAHEDFAVEAFDIEAVDYVLKPVAAERLERAIDRAVARRERAHSDGDEWLAEFWVPHRSELLRIDAERVERI